MPERRHKIVLDTNVIIAASRSAQGASAEVLKMTVGGSVDLCLSVALALEYETVLKREIDQLAIQLDEAETLVDYLCANAERFEPASRMWPLSADPDDERVVRLVLTTGCDFLVTHNISDFTNVVALGVAVVTPAEFLQRVRSEL